jgi:hypothetical protein
MSMGEELEKVTENLLTPRTMGMLPESSHIHLLIAYFY